MQTECPHCHTVFRIAQAQLDAADGKVRCGFCKEVFVAKVANGVHDTETGPEGSASNQLPEAALTQVNTGDVNETPLPAERSDATHGLLENGSDSGHYSAAATAAWSLAILALIAALVTEYLWFNQPELFRHARLQPIATKLCERVDCERLQKRDPSRIEMVSRNIYSHPNEQKALMISTTLVNQASYAQPYPEVQIDFSNVRGELIASRRFTPEEYLQTDKQQIDLLPSGTPVTFGLEISDPGKHAITYEFSFH